MIEAHRLENAPLSKIREIIDYANQLEAKGKQIIHLEIGEPDFNTPSYISDAAKEALDHNMVHYSPVSGIPELRKALSAYANKRYNLNYDDRDIIITHGVAHGIFLSIMAFLNPGDEILVPAPGYLCYFTVPNIAEAKAVSYFLSEENKFQINEEQLEHLITPKTKAILINSPSNPIGSILNFESLKIISRIAEKYDLLIISDEVYADMTYDDTAPFHSIATIPEAKERTIVLNGFSKYFAMTGWRIGYIMCPHKLFNPLMRLSFYNFSCPNTFVQYAALKAVTESDKESQEMVKEYKLRRDFMIQRLNKLPGCSCLKPSGAFYIFMNIKETGMTDNEFSTFMLDQVGVSLTPGSVFGSNCDNFVRISYSNSLENLIKACDLMEQALNQHFSKRN